MAHVAMSPEIQRCIYNLLPSDLVTPGCTSFTFVVSTMIRFVKYVPYARTTQFSNLLQTAKCEKEGRRTLHAAQLAPL